jgi:hypothetical protein
LTFIALLLAPALVLSANVKLAWDLNTPKPTGYRIYQRAQNQSYNFNKPVWTGSKPPAIVKNLKNGTTYYFVVKAYKGKLIGPPSNEVAFSSATSIKLPANKVAIVATAGSGGSVAPSGTVVFNKNTWKKILIKPKAGYIVADVVVDGKSVGAVTQYLFKKVTANHTISATFASKNSSSNGGQASASTGGKVKSVPGTIQAEDYDKGGEGAAYHDTTRANLGKKYRQDGVDIWQNKGGFYVGAMANREWLQYTVNVKTTGTYSLDLRVATKQKGCKVRILSGGKKLVGPITLPNTGSPSKWATVMTTVRLKAGKNVLRLFVDRGGFNLDRIDIEPIGSNDSGLANSGSGTTGGSNGRQQPYDGRPIRLPGTVEAERYDKGGEGVAYHDTTRDNRGRKFRQDGVDIWQTKGGFYTGANISGEWLEYTVNAAYTGTYKVNFRVATAQSGRKIRLKLDGKAITGAIPIPKTGAANKWRTVSKVARFTKGQHVLRVEFVAGGFNLDWIDIN